MRTSLLLQLLLLTSLAYASRISGTYVDNEKNFTLMLQLTETNNGQINGVVSWLELDNNGDLKSGQKAVSGSVDEDQLTLNIGTGLESFLFGTTVAGRVSGNTIKLQRVDSEGGVASYDFTRSTVATFNAKTSELKKQGAYIINCNKLLNHAQKLRQVVSRSEAWITNAQLHAQRLPNVKTRYEQIEAKMRSMVAIERTIADTVQRGQISVAVGQGNIAGDQVDLDVNQLWDLTIESEGTSLAREFSSWDGSCAEPADLHKRASAQSIESWEHACKVAAAERDRFIPGFKSIMRQRVDLKSFQAKAQARRMEIVKEASALSRNN